MTTVTLNKYSEECDKNIVIDINMEEGDSVPFNVAIDSGWYDLQGIGFLIKELQKAKRILKTRQIKEGD